MKRLVAGLTVLLVLVPAAFFMCRCCPVVTSQEILKIESANCHGCCAKSIAVAKDCAVIRDHSSHAVTQEKFFDFFTGFLHQNNWVSPVREFSLASQPQSPPQIFSPALSVVLRI